MAVPSFVSIGGATGAGSGTTLTPGLPASRVNNNILISFCSVQGTGKTVTTATTGWTVGDSINAGSISAAWAWRLVDGTETAAVWTWTGSAANVGVEIQYSGNATVSPINTNNKANADSSSQVTIAALTTGADNCEIVDFITTSTNQTIPTPIGMTTRLTSQGGNGSMRISDGQMGKAGATEAESFPITSDNWVTFGIAILGSGTGTTPNARVTSVSAQVLEAQPLSENNVRVTSVSQQVLEAQPASENHVRVTSVSMQVLRTVSSITTLPFIKGFIID